MKKFGLAIIVYITPIFFTGCFRYECIHDRYSEGDFFHDESNILSEEDEFADEHEYYIIAE